MTSLKFEKCGVDPRTGETLYRLIIGRCTVREDLTLDQVVEAINSAFGLGRDDRDEGGADPGESLSPAEPDSSP